MALYSYHEPRVILCYLNIYFYLFSFVSIY